MNDDVAEILDDILGECLTVREFVAGCTFEDYVADKKTRFAVERCFEIIGEGMARLARIAPCLSQSIRDYRAIKSFRNILSHAYDHVEDRIVWGIIEGDLARLMEDIERLRKAGDV